MSAEPTLEIGTGVPTIRSAKRATARSARKKLK